MPDRVLPGPVQENSCIREAVCVHTRKIYDSCRDKDYAPCKHLFTLPTVRLIGLYTYIIIAMSKTCKQRRIEMRRIGRGAEDRKKGQHSQARSQKKRKSK